MVNMPIVVILVIQDNQTVLCLCGCLFLLAVDNQINRKFLELSID
jgi:hypothetical protein